MTSVPPIPVGLLLCPHLTQAYICEDTTKIRHEAAMLLRLEHPHVVSFHGLWQVEDWGEVDIGVDIENTHLC